MQVRQLRIMARAEQDVADLMLYRWPDYEIEINCLPIPAVEEGKWYEVTLVEKENKD
ncbi:MAG: hypothetical protein H6Q65_1423 [Firmicutes bacterium]|nr:hypothetical protein [Bacillota bacterium]